MDTNITISVNELELLSYNVIRREVSNFQRTTNDAELGNFVKGVVALEKEIYITKMNEMINTPRENKES